MEEPAVDEVAPPSPAPSSETEPEAEDADGDAQTNEPADPALADWFKVDAPKGKAPAWDEDIAESETEPESDNEDVRDDDAEIDELADELADDWSQISAPDKASPKPELF